MAPSCKGGCCFHASVEGRTNRINEGWIQPIEADEVSGLELINIMADADVLTDLSVQEGDPQYLLLARKTPYQQLAGQFPLYDKLEELVSDENNHIILTP